MNKKVQNLIEELGPTLAKTVATENREGKVLKVSFGNSKIYSPAVHMQSEELESLIIESYIDAAKGILEAFNYDTKKYNFLHLAESAGFIPGMTILNEEESSKISIESKPELSIKGKNLVIEIPLELDSVGELDSFGAPIAHEIIKESFRNIQNVLLKGLNEETAKVSTDAEVDIDIEKNKLVIEIPLSSNVKSDQISEAQISDLLEEISVIRNLLREGITFDDIYPEDQFKRDSLIREFALMEDTKAVDFLGRLNENSLMLFESMFDTYIGSEIFLNEKEFLNYLKNTAGKAFVDPVKKLGNRFKYGGKQLDNFFTGVGNRFSNNVNSVKDQAFNFGKTIKDKVGNFVSNMGDRAVVNMRSAVPMAKAGIDTAVEKIKRKFKTMKAGNSALDDYQKKLVNPITGALELRKAKKEAEATVQSQKSEKLLNKRKELADKIKNNGASMSPDELAAAKAELKDATKATGGFLGDVTRKLGKFFTGKDNVPRFALNDKDREEIKVAGQTNKDNLAGLRKDAIDTRNKAENEYTKNLPANQQAEQLAKLNKERIDSIEKVKKNLATQQAATTAQGQEDAKNIELTRQADNKLSLTKQNEKNNTIKSDRTLDDKVIDADRKLESDRIEKSLSESYSREDLLELFEALNLDTAKYTFNYLAEELGFQVVKPNILESLKRR
jgi:hypothetical protein